MAWTWSEGGMPRRRRTISAERARPQPPPHVLTPPAPRTRSPLTSPQGLRDALSASASDPVLLERPAMQWEKQYGALPSSGFRLRNSNSTQFDCRQNKGHQYRQYLEDVKNKTDAHNLGTKGVAGFRAFMKKQ